MSLDRWINQKLLLLLIAQLSAASISSQFLSANRIYEDCNKINSYSLCNCLPISDGFNITCPGEGTSPKITVVVIFQLELSVEIDCRGMDPLNYSLLPKMDIGDITEVRMHQCQLPQEQPIQTILQKLGITRVNFLSFKSSIPGKTLRRLHFQGLDNLKNLRLDISNAIPTLPDDVFDELKNLTWLTLRSNKVELSPSTFASLANLEFLQLIDTKITFLPAGLFSANKNLILFHLYNNRVELKQLPVGVLSNLHILREVILNCYLETISTELFANSTAIESITISENNLTELPPMLFADQKRLGHLNLARNKLIALPDEIFQNTSKLIVLRLSYNRLENITRHIFKSLKNLKELYMDNNNLVRISPQAFEFTYALNYIDMENNQINLSYPTQGLWWEWSPFSDLSELTTLNLSNNSITFIPNCSSLRLRHLDLSYNNITVFGINNLNMSRNNVSINLTHNTIRTINFDGIDDQFYPYFPWTDVAIGENPIKCDCGLASFVHFLNGTIGQHLKGALTVSTDQLQCNSPASLKGRLVTGLLRKDIACPLNKSITQELCCPTGCVCLEERFDRILIVDCSNARLIEIPALSRTEIWKGTELHMKNNSLAQISVGNLPKNMVLLDLSYNNLQQLSRSVLNALTTSITFYSIALSHNPWMCDCQSEDLYRFAHSYDERFPDLKEMQCVSGEKFLEISIGTICSGKKRLVIAVGVIIAVIGLCVGAIAVFYQKYQIEIKVWLYAHKMCLWFVTEEELDKDKKYDAFISFSQKDEDFITDHLIPELENGPTPFRLCLHFRDWMAGDLISEQIIRSVDESRRTIIVLSTNFIESNWSRMEFRTAHSAALNEGRARVIVIIFGDIGNTDTLDPDLKAYLRMHTYVKWGDPWFWDKLRYALPHRNDSQPHYVNESQRTNDWLELSSLT